MSLTRGWRLAAFLALLCLSDLYISVNCTRNNAVPDKPKGDYPKLAVDKKHEPWAHKVFESLVAGVHSSAHKFLHSVKRGDGNSLQVPLAIDILLIGFEANGGFRCVHTTRSSQRNPTLHPPRDTELKPYRSYCGSYGYHEFVN
eukprot:717334-Pyramimonas_sp.AAC.2